MKERQTIVFSDTITVDSVRNFIASIMDLYKCNQRLDELNIALSSPGGDVELAFELYNFIKTLDCRVVMYNTSYVSSAAVVLFLAGDERISLPYTSFYLHSISKKYNCAMSIKELERELREMRTNYNKIVKLLEGSTCRTKAHWRRLMTKGTVILPQKALEYGLITQIVGDRNEI